MLIKDTNKPDNQLKNEDLLGAKPKIFNFVTGRLPSNPLDPQYKLPFYEVREATPPKFIRDSIKIDDIYGTKPLANFNYKLRKQPYQYPEIEGAKATKRFIPKDHLDAMNVEDINKYREFKTNRITNPLDPVYKVVNEEGQPETIGLVNGSKSR